MVNFNEKRFDTWENACQIIEEFTGINLGNTVNEKVVLSIVQTQVVEYLCKEEDVEVLNIYYNIGQIFIKISRTKDFNYKLEDIKYGTTLSEVIFNCVLDVIKELNK